jgi:hypothetical protein
VSTLNKLSEEFMRLLRDAIEKSAAAVSDNDHVDLGYEDQAWALVREKHKEMLKELMNQMTYEIGNSHYEFRPIKFQSL